VPASDSREGCTIKRALIALSLTLALLVAGLLPAAAVAGQPITGTKLSVPGGSYRAVTPRELATLLKHKHFLLVNVHYPYAGELPRTDRFIHYDTIGQHLSSLPANKHAMIMLYCRSGRMSDIAARAGSTWLHQRVASRGRHGCLAGVRLRPALAVALALSSSCSFTCVFRPTHRQTHVNTAPVPSRNGTQV
jgi:hypothetical protein